MHHKNKGIVLISILLIVLLLSSIAVLFGNKYLISLKRAQYIEFQTLAINIFRNIESLSKDKIKKEFRFNSAKLTKQNPILNNDFILKINDAEVISRVSDASSCFNINSLVSFTKGNYVENEKSINAFKRLMYLAEVENNVTEEAIDQIIDWIDKDSNPRAYGLEDYYYSGPLHNPREYSAMRLIVSIDELKSIPAIRQINWDIFKQYFCALPSASNLSFNINTLSIDDVYLISSIFPNISLKDAEYIIDNIPEEGFDNFVTFEKAFPELDFSSPYGNILYSSNIFEITTTVKFDKYIATSISKMIYENNKNGYIISRIYNGI